MNHIQSLMQKHCPNGVEFRALGEVIKIYTGEQFNKRDMQKVGDYPVINGGIYPSGYTNKFNENENTITISQGGASAGFVNFMLCKFWAGAHCYVVKTCPPVIANEQSECGNLESRKLDCHESLRDSRNDEVSNKFIFYFLKSQETKLMNLKHGAGIPALNSNHIKKLQIPIPPLEIQKEIVKILDSFTELEKELEKELEARRKQYEYYREKLLSFESLVARAGGGQFVKMMRLGEIGSFVRGNGLQKKDFVKSGVPCIHYGQIYTHYGTFTHETKSFVSEEVARKLKKANTGNLIIAGVSENKEDVCKAVVYLGNDEICISGDSFAFAHSQNPKFIGYFFQTDNFNKQKTKHITGTKVMRVHIDNLKTFQIPIPPLKVQNEVVEILDRFDALVNDITSGIPAEIATRKKQYEYYRERLLSFKEVE